ncbi:MAG: SIMPL domain-containing protein, partial [Rhizobiaceae bacterium]|nr:SIMPL domain-containing protein [Rhizobiaceae bacterium]
MICRHALFRFAAPFVVFGCSPLAGPAFVSAAEAQEVRAGEPRQIIVTGVGEASGTPDIATTSLTVLRTSATARAALDGANAAMAEVVGAMKTLGVEARDLQTSGFQIAPQYRYDTSSNGNQQPPTLIGYEVRNTLTVRIRDIAAVGAILDRAVSLGV